MPWNAIESERPWNGAKKWQPRVEIRGQRRKERELDECLPPIGCCLWVEPMRRARVDGGMGPTRKGARSLAALGRPGFRLLHQSPPTPTSPSRRWLDATIHCQLGARQIHADSPSVVHHQWHASLPPSLIYRFLSYLSIINDRIDRAQPFPSLSLSLSLPLSLFLSSVVGWLNWLNYYRRSVLWH